jgi:predicted TIM-barrel fold metal-dependent hydrolase
MLYRRARMGIIRGIFVIDTHVHAQRHAFKFKEHGVKPDYRTLAKGMPLAEVYDNSDRLLYHMERYGVDMCVIQPAFGMTNELNAEIVKKHPDKFVALCNAVETDHRALRNEHEWTIEAACKEIDALLSTGQYVGIGEGLPKNPQLERKITWPERFEQICQIMDIAKKHNVPTGTLSGYAGAGVAGLHEHDWASPLLAHEVAAAYADVPIILAHGGMQGWWSEMYYEQALNVAAAHPNVYLETGLYWAELYEKPLRDPNIGVERLIWGTDWGASIPQQWVPGFHPASYADQSRTQGLAAHQVDYYGWSLRQLGKAVDMLDLPQDDVNLILGGNAVKLFKLDDKVPYRRLFKEYLK